MRTLVRFVVLLGSVLLAVLPVVAPAIAEASAISGGMWVSAANLNTARRDSAGVLLRDGRVLVAGGWNAPSLATQPFSSAELYDPVSDTWSYAAPMLTPRTFPTATLL